MQTIRSSNPILMHQPFQHTPFTERPSRREVLLALALAAACSLSLLGSAVSPTRAVVPFVPEVYEPWRSESLADPEFDPESLTRGAPALGDKYGEVLLWDRVNQEALREGELPVWRRELGGGAPWVPQMAQPYQPWNLLLLIPGLPSCGIYGPWLFLHHVLFGWTAFWFLRRLGVGTAGAAFGLCLAVTGLWTQARTHHNTILSAVLPLFPLWTTIGAAFHEHRVLGSVPRKRIGQVALLLGLSWSAGFAQLSLQVTITSLGWALLLTVQGAAGPRRYAPLRALAIGTLLGASISLAQMVPCLLAALETSRPTPDAEFLVAQGLRAEHLWTLLWPDWLHGPATGTSRPSFAALAQLEPRVAREFNWPETAFTPGTAAVLTLLGWLRIRSLPAGHGLRGCGCLLTFGGLLALLYAAGWRPLAELAVRIPGAAVGDPKRALFTTAMALIPLAAIGLELLTRDRHLRRLAAVAAGASCCAALWLGWPAWTLDDAGFAADQARRIASNPHVTNVTFEQIQTALAAAPEEVAANRAAVSLTALRAAITTLLLLLAVLRLRGARLAWACGVITLLELASTTHGIIQPVPTARVTTPPRLFQPALDATATADAGQLPRPRFGRLHPPDQGGLFGLCPPNLAAYHGLEDAFAYHPISNARLEELYGAIEPGTWMASGGMGTIGFFRRATLASPWIDLLGIEFVLTQGHDLPEDGRWRDATPHGLPRNVRLWQRTEPTWPRATFVDRAELVAERNERVARLATSDAETLRTTVTLEDPSAPEAQGDRNVEARVTVITHTDTMVRVRVKNAEPGYLRLADPFDPGWRATLDGIPTQIFAADHRLRAIHVAEAGEHMAEFRYSAPHVWLPRWISLVASVLALALLLPRRARS